MDRLRRLSAHLCPPSNAVVAAIVASGDEYDLVVRGGSIVDGTGAAAFDSDVGVRDGKIAAVGPGLGKGAREIDARGRLVTPGFVDVCVTAALSLRGPTAPAPSCLRAPLAAPCSVLRRANRFHRRRLLLQAHALRRAGRLGPVLRASLEQRRNHGHIRQLVQHTRRTHSCIWTD